jgi:hypothetical protein
MPLSDASLSAPTLYPAILFYANFADMPIRAALAPCPIHVPVGLADSDSDCAGFTFETLNSDVLEIGPVDQSEGGGDTLNFTLLADPTDTALMNAIEDPALYVGRPVRVWLALWDPNAAPVGGGAVVTQLKRMKRAYMTQPTQSGDGERYVISMQAENYLNLLTGAQGRSYAQTALFDAADQAGRVIRAGRGSAPWVPGGGGNTEFHLRGLEDQR